MDRRSFLTHLSLLSLAPSCASWIPVNTSPDKLASTFIVKDTQGKLAPFLSLVNSQNKIIQRFPLLLAGHSVISPRHRPHYFLVLTQGKESTFIDTSKSTSRQIPSLPGYFFYGHGAFATDGATFYTTERKPNGAGKIVIRGTESLEIQKAYDLPGLGPHDCCVLNDGATLAVAMDGGAVAKDGYITKTVTSEILFLDLKTGRLIGRSLCDDPELGFGHIALTSSGNLIVACMNYPQKNDRGSSFLVTGKSGERLEPFSLPKTLSKRLTRQSLSLVVDHYRHHAIATYPADQLVIRFDINSRQYLDHAEIPTPHGISVSQDGSKYLVTSKDGSLHHISSDDFKLSSHFGASQKGFFDAHHLSLGM